jgi:hypothetical protein
VAAEPLPVLLHAGFYAALRRLPGARQARFRQVLRHLAAGRWGGGTRVKKLRGVAKPVFEARHDGGDRVLFTLARSASPDGGEGLQTYLQVWDLVAHDRVTRTATRVNRAPEAEFLDYEELEAEATAEPPPHPGATFDEVPSTEPGASAGVFELMLPPDDFRPPEREDLIGGIRWYMLPARVLVEDGEWQALVDGGSEELELKLTAEQYAVVRAPGPVLLSGSAGSGKTTIAAHRLAAATAGPAPVRALYLTYSRWLRDHARRLYEALLACRGQTPARAPDFLTMEELYRSLADEATGAGVRLVDYPAFARWYAGAYRRSDAALAWEEIRSIVKGACLDPDRPLLRRDEYEALGRKRAPLFVGERPRLHEVALRWQDWLRAGAAADEVDLCRRARARIGHQHTWDHVICDEAQDLTELQLDLVLRLHRDPALQGLFLAGDPQQVINPSGFRWAEVRSALRERLRPVGRSTPALTALARNFRSVRGLVELANAVLAWKRERTGRSDGDQAEDSAVAGATPLRVEGSEAELVAAVAGFGPRCAVVAGSEGARGRLQTLLDTTRIFTVPEAKGLEFDIVVLWGIAAGEPAPWTRLLDPALDLREDPASRRALHHLYVAVTRARRHLAVYEPSEAPPVWTSPWLQTRLDVESPPSLARLFARAASPAEWIREGEYFLERERHRQAAECFRRAGAAEREAECLALHHEQAGDGRLAARLWLELGQRARAAGCLEHADAWAEAAALWAEEGDEAAARRCRVRAAEAARDWPAAAAAWEALEAWTDAARCWGQAGQRIRQLRCLATAAEGEARFADAARHWEAAEAWEPAAAAWHRAGRSGEAHRTEALGHEAARRWAAAARAWEAAGDPRRALHATAAWAETEQRWVEAAEAWERLDDPGAAARAWKRAGRPAEAARCEIRVDLLQGRFARAAETLEQIGDLDAAAAAWQQAHEAGQAPGRPAPLPLPPAARRRWVEGGRPARLIAPRRPTRRGPRAEPPGLDARTRALACAVTAAEAAGRLEEAEARWRALGDPEQALRCQVSRLEASGQPAAAAALLEERGRLEAAARAWARAGEPGGQGRCQARLLEKRKRWNEAAARWTALGEAKLAAICRGRHHVWRGEYAQAAEAFAEGGDLGAALDLRILAARAAGDWDGALALAREAGRPDLVAELTRARPAPAAAARARGRRHAPDTAPPPGPPRQGTLFDAPASADLDRVVEIARTHPGAGAAGVARFARLPAARVQALLRQAVAAGALVKTGRTRGTRYWPPAVPR